MRSFQERVDFLQSEIVENSDTIEELKQENENYQKELKSLQLSLHREQLKFQAMELEAEDAINTALSRGVYPSSAERYTLFNNLIKVPRLRPIGMYRDQVKEGVSIKFFQAEKQVEYWVKKLCDKVSNKGPFERYIFFRTPKPGTKWADKSVVNEEGVNLREVKIALYHKLREQKLSYQRKTVLSTQIQKMKTFDDLPPVLKRMKIKKVKV